MNRYINASRDICTELEETNENAMSAFLLLRDVIDSYFDDCSLNGILENGESRETAALDWMEKNYTGLMSACYAARVLMDRVTNTLMLWPTPIEGNSISEKIHRK